MTQPATNNIFEKLRAPFDRADVYFLPRAFTLDGSKALALGYVHARKPRQRLNALT